MLVHLKEHTNDPLRLSLNTFRSFLLLHIVPARIEIPFDIVTDKDAGVQS